MEIGIIGAGASGMMAALTAAGNGAKVTLIEKKDRIGKKLLATGNGKCNFTNKRILTNDYNSQYANILNDYISQFDEKAVLSFFEEKGMLVKDRNGYCYPRSEQAATVLDIFRSSLKVNKNISILLERYPVRMRKQAERFEVMLNTGEKLYFDRLILACGSYAGERSRDEYNGYSYAKGFRHSIVPVVPALVQLRAANAKVFKAIGGVRSEARLQLFVGGKAVCEEQGELQLTEYGISGIPVFQLSRFAAYGIYEKQKVVAVIDFLPEFTGEAWEELVHRKWKQADKSLTAEEFFQGFLNKKLNLFFCKEAGIKADMLLTALKWEQVKRAAMGMKAWKVEIAATNPYENAQVCAGGVSMEEVTLHLESKVVPGLYFAGEVLDVDGRCGGYNLQWAWSSGYIAGRYGSL